MYKIGVRTIAPEERGQFSSGAMVKEAIIWEVIFLLGNYPRWQLSRGKLSGGQSSRGQLSGGNYPGGNFPRGQLSENHKNIHKKALQKADLGDLKKKLTDKMDWFL